MQNLLPAALHLAEGKGGFDIDYLQRVAVGRVHGDLDPHHDVQSGTQRLSGAQLERLVDQPDAVGIDYRLGASQREPRLGVFLNEFEVGVTVACHVVLGHFGGNPKWRIELVGDGVGHLTVQFVERKSLFHVECLLSWIICLKQNICKNTKKTLLMRFLVKKLIE